MTYCKEIKKQDIITIIFRREALEESLTENECLHTSLSLLEEEHEKVKEEADTYRSLAEQAQVTIDYERLKGSMHEICWEQTSNNVNSKEKS